MSEQPFYVVETSGYRIAPDHGTAQGRGTARDRGTEHELAVVGPSGVHAWHRTVERGPRYTDETGRTRAAGGRGHVAYSVRLAKARAAAASVCAILNAEGGWS